MRSLFTLISLLLSLNVFAQNYKLNVGDTFPDINFRPIVNAPIKEVNLKNQKGEKLYIVNFWGTWCSPCIPEMGALAKLQAKYQNQIQVIGLSNDPKEKLQKFARNKPSKIWLASDTSQNLYRMLDFSYVGQAIVLNAQHKIIGMYKTGSISNGMIQNLLKGKVPPSDAETKGRPVQTAADPFGLDSTIASSFSLRSYMVGQQTMGKRPQIGPFAFRRITFYNLPVTTFYKTAYGIVSESQVIYEADKKKYDDFDDYNQRYCMDLLVPGKNKDSLLVIMQHKLNENLPLKGRIETRAMTVYLLKNKKINAPVSVQHKSSISFSGNGFDGTGILMKEFADGYLTNELELPVIDETNLTDRYDIKTTNDVRDKRNILTAINKLGLILEKAERQVKVLVLYEKK